MKKYKLLSIMFLATILSNCGDDNNLKNSLISIDNSKFQPTYYNNETVSIEFNNPNAVKIDSAIFYLNNKKIESKSGLPNFQFKLDNVKYGKTPIKVIAFANGDSVELNSVIEIVSDISPKLLSYEIVNIYPHNSTSYTQGLEFYRDTLFEGTGQRGQSKLLKTNAKTGEIYQTVNLAGKFFGEGITILKNKVYQLTWQENTGFIYNADNLKLEKEFTYYKPMQGWGLCNDGSILYQSDGTEKIYLLDPTTLKEVDFISVYSGKTKITAVNELEWVNGMIYGNVYQKDAIAKINPKNGAVEGIVNLSDLKTKVKVQDRDNEVLNGIAFNTKTKTFFVTGKNWDKMFEIKIND